MLLIVFGLIVIIGFGLWLFWFKGDNAPAFRTAAVKRGDLIATISATGTVEPEKVVDVGAQVGGMVRTFGEDEKGKLIDYGSVVKAGMVLARMMILFMRGCKNGEGPVAAGPSQ